MLRLEGISYRYAGASEPTITGLDLDLSDGEVIGVAGACESGKSTLCLVASGLAPRAIRGVLTGSLLVDGKDVGRVADAPDDHGHRHRFPGPGQPAIRVSRGPYSRKSVSGR